jgi:DNA-binding response OmpR family regulator
MPEVLIVDDDPHLRKLLAATLDGAGYTIWEEPGGAEALAALERLAPDCMVLDLMMPGIDGFGVLRERRRRGLAPDTRVLVLTAKTAERDYAKSWEQGADEYLVKPFDPEDVIAAVEELLAASPAELAERRESELRKAELLERLSSAFNRPRMGSR